MPPPIRRGPRGPGGEIPDPIARDLLQAAKRRRAESAIAGRWNQLGGSPGVATIPGDSGLIKVADGFYRQYEKGRIYYRFNFDPIHVYGAIGDRYTQLGGPSSWLGWPTFMHAPEEDDKLTKLDEQPFPQDGRVSTFEHGAIYWWADTGAIELGHISVRYTGLACFSDTHGGGSDEPYLLFGTVPAPPTATSETRTVIYNEVDGGESREDDIELYRGLPYGLSLNVTLMEHDAGDPDKYRSTVKEAVDQASKAVSVGVGAIPSGVKLKKDSNCQGLVQTDLG
jgi:LGFP repeat